MVEWEGDCPEVPSRDRTQSHSPEWALCMLWSRAPASCLVGCVTAWDLSSQARVISTCSLAGTAWCWPPQVLAFSPC